MPVGKVKAIFSCFFLFSHRTIYGLRFTATFIIIRLDAKTEKCRSKDTCYESYIRVCGLGHSFDFDVIKSYDSQIKPDQTTTPKRTKVPSTSKWCSVSSAASFNLARRFGFGLLFSSVVFPSIYLLFSVGISVFAF